MLDVEVLGALDGAREPGPEEIRDLCAAVAAHLGVGDAHVAVEFVDAERIAALNARHRDRPAPTDVLSFPIDGLSAESVAAPRELGDIVICAEHTADVREAVVHGMLHLLGMDHETDDGEMLALQDELMARARR
jgi:probable rRNA maturation factor